MNYTWVSSEKNGIGKFLSAEGEELTLSDDSIKRYFA
jgi:hypothetical protein